MQITKLLPLLLVPALALGCAAETAETESETSELSAGIDFTAAVGVVEVGGKQICTGALVDLEAGATVGAVSLSGRQVVLGGACIGRFSNNYVGGAVFVTHVGRTTVRSPIAAIEFGAGAGFSVGILANSLPNVTPLKPFVGFSAGAHAGVQAATILRTDENGVQVGAKVGVEVGVEFNLSTRCTDWHFKAELEAGVGATASVGEITGAAAIVRVGGELQFAASIDGQCVAKQIVRGLRLPFDAADAVFDIGGNIGSGKVIANYALEERVSTVRIYFYESASELRLNAVGRVSATAPGASCDALFGACTLRPAGGFRKGTTVDVVVDTHLPDLGSIFGGGTTDVLFSVPE